MTASFCRSAPITSFLRVSEVEDELRTKKKSCSFNWDFWVKKGCGIQYELGIKF